MQRDERRQLLAILFLTHLTTDGNEDYVCCCLDVPYGTYLYARPDVATRQLDFRSPRRTNPLGVSFF